MQDKPCSTTTRLPEFSLLDLLGIARRHWRLLVAATIGALVASYAGTFLIHHRYEASGSILPRQAGSVRGMSSILESGKIRGGLRIVPTTSRNSVNIERLLSQELRSSIVDSLDLVGFYGLGKLAERNPAAAHERAMTKLLGDSQFELSIRVDVLIIHAVTKDPEMSRKIVDAYLDELQRLNLDFLRTQAKSRVRYFQRRLEELRGVIARAEADLAHYQADAGLADLDQQRDSALSLIARLRNRIGKLELRQSMLAQDLTPESPERQALSAEIDVNRSVLQSFLDASVSAGSSALDVLGFPLGDEPSLTAGLRTLQREVRLLQDVESALRVEVERGLLEGDLDVSTYFLLDRPVVPVEPIWPQRKLLVLASTSVVLCGAYLLLLFLEALRQLAGGGRGVLREGLSKL